MGNTFVRGYPADIDHDRVGVGVEQHTNWYFYDRQSILNLTIYLW